MAKVGSQYAVPEPGQPPEVCVPTEAGTPSAACTAQTSAVSSNELAAHLTRPDQT
jgi:hypothetical protein